MNLLKENYPIFFGALSIVLGIFFGIKHPKRSFLSYFQAPQSSLKMGVLIGFSALFLNIGITTFLGKLFPALNPTDTSALRDLMKDSLGKGIVLVLTLLFAPIAEEILFRGYLIDGIQHFFKRTELAAIFYSAGAFALCHGLTQIPGVFIFGACLGWIRIHSKSLRMAIFFHALNNTFGLGMLYFRLSEPSSTLAAILLVLGSGTLWFSINLRHRHP